MGFGKERNEKGKILKNFFRNKPSTSNVVVAKFNGRKYTIEYHNGIVNLDDVEKIDNAIEKVSKDKRIMPIMVNNMIATEICDVLHARKVSFQRNSSLKKWNISVYF